MNLLVTLNKSSKMSRLKPQLSLSSFLVCRIVKDIEHCIVWGKNAASETGTTSKHLGAMLAKGLDRRDCKEIQFHCSG